MASSFLGSLDTGGGGGGGGVNLAEGLHEFCTVVKRGAEIRIIVVLEVWSSNIFFTFMVVFSSIAFYIF